MTSFTSLYYLNQFVSKGFLPLRPQVKPSFRNSGTQPGTPVHTLKVECSPTHLVLTSGYICYSRKRNRPLYVFVDIPSFTQKEPYKNTTQKSRSNWSLEEVTGIEDPESTPRGPTG